MLGYPWVVEKMKKSSCAEVRRKILIMASVSSSRQQSQLWGSNGSLVPDSVDCDELMEVSLIWKEVKILVLQVTQANRVV